MADTSSRQGTQYVTPDILRYLNELHVPHDEALARAFNAPELHGMPAIQVGISEGKLLGMLLRMIRARKAVEFGTLAGYSALHIARSLPKDGQLWTLELSPDHARVARENLEAAGLADRVTVVVGPALELLPELAKHGPFDAVFLDADKGYPPQPLLKVTMPPFSTPATQHASSSCFMNWLEP